MRYFMYIFFLSILLIPAKSQPVTQLEQGEDLIGIIGSYINSMSYEGSDSAWINATKRLQTLNDAGRAIEFIQYKWENDDWHNEMRTIYIFENDTLLKETNGFNWENDNWKENSKNRFIYDLGNKVIENITEALRDSIWVIASHIFYTYDNDGRLIETVNRQNGGIRNDTVKTSFTFDEEGNLITIYNQKYQSGAWVDLDITEFLYVNGRNIKSERKFWYAGFQENDFIDSVVYNEQGQVTERIHLKWYDDVYEKDYRDVFTYDQNGRNTDFIHQNWGGKSWNNFNKNIFIYDNNGNTVKKQRQKYRNDAWQDEQDIDMRYNSNNKLTEFTKNLWFIDHWQRNARLTYDYPPTAVEESEKVKIFNAINFPNPFSEETTIEFNLKQSDDISFTVFDLKGRLIYRNIFRNLNAGRQQIKIIGGVLPNGTYIYNINSGKDIISNMFIVNK